MQEFELETGSTKKQIIAGLRTGDFAFQSSAQQPLTLCLHGWLDNAASFTPLLAHWPSQRHLAALDFPGHGRSFHRSEGAWYYFTEYVADLVALFEHHDLQHVHLVGHSMGGFVGQVVAAVVPERVARLTLIEAFGLWVKRDGEWVTQLKNALTERRKLAQKRPPVYSDKERLIRLRAETSNLNPDLARFIVERNLREVPGGYTWTVDPRVRLPSLFRFSASHAHELLSTIRCPVDVVLGDCGTPEILQALDAWGATVAQKTVYTLKGGHHVHMEQPEEVVRILTGNAQMGGSVLGSTGPI
ncbi:alpha/beta fold hydrolase [Aliidiomarina sanyensis]|uniref:alpha/beta fold hydrolase n=1 Tax=Aliidiomarina sanyensis TaxID=1249555 RepID=UPI001A7E0609|nr:alpha/beta hydrolase [Aliidiomarina sanyensis]